MHYGKTDMNGYNLKIHLYVHWIETLKVYLINTLERGVC